MKGLAQSTQVYTSGQKRFLDFCASAGLRAVPAEEEVLCKFAAKLANEGLRHRTIKYMAGIRHLHIEEGLADPFLPALPHLEGSEEGRSRRRRSQEGAPSYRSTAALPDEGGMGSPGFQPRSCHAVGCMLPGLLWVSPSRGIYGAV